MPAADRMPAREALDARALNDRGNALRTCGRTAEALASYEAALTVSPDDVAALFNRGSVLLELARPDDALASFDRVLALAPADVEALTMRGNALVDSRRLAEAIESYDRALALAPECVAALYSRGNALMELQRTSEAVACYEKALALRPDFDPAMSNCGDALLQLRRPGEALAIYERALAQRPEDADALVRCGRALQALKRDEDALARYDRALAIAPDHAGALNNRGNALLALRQLDEALQSYDRALALDPSSSGVLTNRGNALLELARPEEALASYDRALAIDPACADALYDRGLALQRLQRNDEAGTSFARLLALAPNASYAPGNLLDCKLRECDWKGLAELIARIDSALLLGERAITPFVYLTISQSAAAQLQCARSYATRNYPPSANPLWDGERYRHDRIRIAYLSPDFREHAVAYLLVGLLEAHDRRRFETMALAFGFDANDGMRHRLRAAFDHFVDVRAKSDREAAQMLREREIDIAVDLSGYTTDCRPGILAHRPAPVQVNFLGYPGTLGAEHIDYILADRSVIPEDEQVHYAEKVVYLPDCFQPNDSTREIAARAPSRADVGLPQNAFVFCSFNNNYKILPYVFDVWMRLLQCVDGSLLWLRETSATAADNLRREAASRGITPQRLVFAAKTLRLEDHLVRYAQADLFLDTLPYNAHTTASDALWAGLPVLTCSGDTYAGRVAGSLLHALGLPELVARSVEEYESVALKLATTPKLLSALRARLAASRLTSPLFDTDRYRRHIEAAYVTMWERCERGEPPASFAVPAMATAAGRGPAQ